MGMLKVTMLIPTRGDPSALLDLAQEAAAQLAKDMATYDEEDDSWQINDDVLDEVRNATSVEHADDEPSAPFIPKTVDLSDPTVGQ